MDIAFHIGYHKTASSWLQQVYFPTHPEIVKIDNSKRPWDDPLLRYLIATSDLKFNPLKCSELLKQKMVSGVQSKGNVVSLISAERLSGYPMSGGYDSGRIAERIYSVAPEAKIIIVVREQIEMISSVYRQMVHEGFPGRFVDMLHSKAWKTVGFDPDFYEYDILINRYNALFGENNIIVLPYELLRADSAEFVRRICDFLGITVIAPPKKKKKVNLSLPDSILNATRCLNHFRRSELNPYPVFNVPDGIRRLLIKPVSTISRIFGARQHFLTQETEQWIVDYYKESNIRLNKMVGINFSDYHDTQEL